MLALGLALTFLLMLLIWEMFVPIGRMLGRLLEDHPRTVWAYSLNIAGSLTGIWLFVLLSAMYAPPVVWFLVAGRPVPSPSRRNASIVRHIIWS